VEGRKDKEGKEKSEEMERGRKMRAQENFLNQSLLPSTPPSPALPSTTQPTGDASASSLTPLA
jgi:hypothetical protein